MKNDRHHRAKTATESSIGASAVPPGRLASRRTPAPALARSRRLSLTVVSELSRLLAPLPRGQQLIPFSSIGAARTRCLPTVICLFCLSIFTVGLTATPAAAKEVRLLSHSFASPGSGDGQLSLLQPDKKGAEFPTGGSGLAVNEVSHDVYVADTGNHRIVQFSASGEFIRAWGADVGGPGVNTCTSGCLPGTSGSAPDAFEAPAFVAVDNSTGLTQGDVYVADVGDNLVSKFDASGNLVSSWGLGGQLSGSAAPFGPFTPIAGIAVDDSGDLWVGSGFRYSGHPYWVYEFSPTSGILQNWTAQSQFDSSTYGLVVDSSSNVYTTSTDLLFKFASTGKLLSQLSQAPTGGIAFNPAGDNLYVATSKIKEPYEGRIEVVDTSCASCGTLETFGEGKVGRPSGVTVDGALGARGAAYVADSASNKINVFEFKVIPDVTTTSKPSNVTATSAVLSGTVNPGGEPIVDCHFEYGITDTYGQSVPCAESPAEVGSGTGPVQVHAEIIALEQNKTYHYRLAVANANNLGEPSEGTDALFGSPRILSASALDVSATNATLQGDIDPQNVATTYHFEYATQAEFEANGFQNAIRVPISDAVAGSGGEVLRSAQVEGLEPKTAYRYRLLATSSLGSAESAALGFTTQGPATVGLPDGRGYELVSPPDKHGAALEGIGGPFGEGADIQAAADGSAISYVARAPVTAEPPNNRSPTSSQLLASRSATGTWQTQDIGIPHGAPAGLGGSATSEYQLFSPDLAFAAIRGEGSDLSVAADATEYTPYIRRPDGSFTSMLTAANVAPGVQFGGDEQLHGAGYPEFITATADFSHLLLSSPKALTEEFSANYHPTYTSMRNIFESSAGVLTLVSQIPSGTSTVCGGSGPACVAASERKLSANVGYASRQVRGAISGDGSRVFFVAGANMYLRDLIRNESVQLDALQGGSGTGNDAARFQLASADGSRVFFTQQRRLTPGSTAGPTKPDLYMCQIEESDGHLACALTDLTANTVDPSEPANLLGAVIGTSEDAGSVYFAANGALTTGEGAVHGDCGQTGKPAEERCNLYRYDTATATLRLIAVLSGADQNDWAPSSEENLGHLTGRVSPNGRYLSFMSQLPLTGYDNRDAKTGVRDQEVYLYDSAADGGEGKVICPSCNPTGARPTGVVATVSPGLLVDRSDNWGGTSLAANIPGWTNIINVKALYQSRFLSDSGRLFFNAADALVPADTNGTFDVYQFEFPQGPGQPASNTCTTASSTYSPISGGCTSLISSGTSPEESAFLDVSESGDDVFFLTASRLTTRDVDTSLDLYDARVGGGEPTEVKPVECSGDACQQPAVPPNDATPGSLTFNGAGNVVECPEGKMPIKGKCVKQKSKKKNHKKSHKKHKKSKRANTNRGGAR